MGMVLSHTVDVALGAAVVAGAAYALANAALRPGSQLFGSTLVAGRNSQEVALTYDDGPNTGSTGELLDVLARHNARATFFMIGRFVREHPEIVRAVQAAGHLIGNHTETHPWLAWQSARVIREELRTCNEALEDALGAPVRYFRPPHGARRPAVMNIACELGLTTVQWNVMGFDWEPIGPDGIVRHVDRGLARAQGRGAGANILLHDGYDQAMGADRSATVKATEILLERFGREGKRVVTVDAWG
jgi:peptidoglycan-N-acetylglucosamine deacetylase